MGRVRVDEVSLEDALTAIHMGSAKYFHPAELEETPLPSLDGLAEALTRDGAAEHAFSIRFPERGDAELVV